MYDQCPIQELETLSLSSFVSNYTDPFSFFHVLPTVPPTHWSRNFTLLSPILLWDAFADPFSGGVGIAIKLSSKKSAKDDCPTLLLLSTLFPLLLKIFNSNFYKGLCLILDCHHYFYIVGSMENCYMPENVIWDILLRLPVKSLMRCRCVCKSWCASISSPFFVTQHLHIQSTSNSDNRLFVLNGTDDAHLLVFDDKICDAVVETVSIPNPYDEEIDKYPKFVGACNGIICVLCLELKWNKIESQRIELWNPATKEMKFLPHFPPQNCYPHFGFGFDAKTSDYKVVGIVHSISKLYPCPPAVEVYSLSTNCWNRIDSQVPFFYFDMRWSGIYTYLDGICYWGAYNKNGYMLLSFDIADEEFQTTPLPIDKYFDVEQICLSVLNGSIALTMHCLDYPNNLSKLDIWLIDKDVKNSSWVKHLTVDYVPSLAPEFKVLPVFGVNDEILLVVGLRLLSYDLESEVVNSLHVTLPSLFRKYGAFVVYKESLVSLKTGNEQLHLQ